MTDFHFDETSPESLGIPSSAVSKMVSAFDKLNQAHSFILLRHGKTASAGAWTPYSLDLPHELFSTSKSFVSCAIGIAQAEKRLNIQDRLVTFFPEYVTPDVSPAMRRVTLRHLLTMTSGHDRCSFQFVDMKHGNWLKEILESPLVYEPGTKFEYNSGATFLLAAVIRKVTGTNVSEYLQTRLFDPLGIEKPQWDCNPQGINIGGWGLWLSTRQLAKFAQLLLHHGKWNGKQLVPEEYLDEATSRQVENWLVPGLEDSNWHIGYGYQFWQTYNQAFRADGAGGQFVVVYRKNDLTLAFNSGISNMDRPLNMIKEILLPELSDSPLPENPEAWSALKKQTAELKAEIPVFMNAKEHFSTGAGDYEIMPNHWNVEKLSLSYTDDACTLAIDGVTITAGYGKFIRNSAALTHESPHIAEAMAAWTSPDDLVIFVLCTQTTARFTFKLHFEDGFVTVARTTPIFFGGNANVVYYGRKH